MAKKIKNNTVAFVPYAVISKKALLHFIALIADIPFILGMFVADIRVINDTKDLVEDVSMLSSLSKNKKFPKYRNFKIERVIPSKKARYVEYSKLLNKFRSEVLKSENEVEKKAGKLTVEEQVKLLKLEEQSLAESKTDYEKNHYEIISRLNQLGKKMVKSKENLEALESKIQVLKEDFFNDLNQFSQLKEELQQNNIANEATAEQLDEVREKIKKLETPRLFVRSDRSFDCEVPVVLEDSLSVTEVFQKLYEVKELDLSMKEIELISKLAANSSRFEIKFENPDMEKAYEIVVNG